MSSIDGPAYNRTTVPASTQAVGGNGVNAAIADAARRTGVDFDFLMNQARIESGFNPRAKAPTSSATGLFQFTKQTWLETVHKHGDSHGLGWAAAAIRKGDDGRFAVDDSVMRGTILNLRNDPKVAALMAAEFASDNKDYLSGALGRPIQSTDLYIAHFLGAKGAKTFLQNMAQNPQMAAAGLFPAAAKANHNIFYAANGQAHSLAEIHSNFARKMAASNIAPPVTAMPPNSSEAGSTLDRLSLRAVSFAAEEPRLRPALRLHHIEPMPDGLSPEFVKRTYLRLSGKGAQ